MPERLRVCSFESRRAEEMRSLIERQGDTATVAPSLQEIPLERNTEVFVFADTLFAGRVDIVIFMTGVGARALVETLQTRYDRADFFAALDGCTIVVRGPKPAAVLREWGVHIDHRVPEPNTWRELLALIDENIPVEEKRVFVQEYGRPNNELYRALQDRGAFVLRVPVYRWELPDDTGPLMAAIRATLAGEFDVLLFTSAVQAEHVLQAAESEGLRDDWLAAARRCVVASIGPTASETLRSLGLEPDVEASPPKMGRLVQTALAQARELLGKKRGV